MISLSVNIDGKGRHSDVPLDKIGEVLAKGTRSLLWLDVVSPTDDDFRLLSEEFAFHPLAIEDAAKRSQRPKIEFYDRYVFLIFYEVELAASPNAQQISFFVGSNYLVTVHDRTCTAIAETAARWTDHPTEVGQRGVSSLVYSLLDAIVDEYFPISDALSDRIDDLEARIFESRDTRPQREIFALRKDLAAIRRVLGPERDVLNVLLRRDTPVFDDEAIPYFQDVYDHVLRVTDNVDAHRDLLGSALDSYLSVTSNRLNQIMKTLTASSIILMSMTLVASIYGMNFDNIPELHWEFGYAWAIGLMAIIGASLAVLFKRIDWF